MCLILRASPGRSIRRVRPPSLKKWRTRGLKVLPLANVTSTLNSSRSLPEACRVIFFPLLCVLANGQSIAIRSVATISGNNLASKLRPSRWGPLWRWGGAVARSLHPRLGPNRNLGSAGPWEVSVLEADRLDVANVSWQVDFSRTSSGS